MFKLVTAMISCVITRAYLYQKRQEYIQHQEERRTKDRELQFSILLEEDPYQTEEYPHTFIYAQPGTG